MSDFQDISTSVVVHGAPKVEKFTPMSGQNAGKEQTVLNFRAYHPNFQRQEDGSFKMLDSDWYDVKYNGKAIEQVQGHAQRRHDARGTRQHARARLERP